MKKVSFTFNFGFQQRLTLLLSSFVFNVLNVNVANNKLLDENLKQYMLNKVVKLHDKIKKTGLVLRK